MITPVKVPETPIILTRPGQDGQDQDGQDSQDAPEKEEVTVATEAASPQEPLVSEVRSPASALSCDPATTSEHPADVPVATLVTTA